jgi:hypothetical protein
MARWQRSPVEMGAWRLRPVVQCDAYVLLQDQRFPVATREVLPNVDTYLASLRACCEIDYGLSGDVRTGVAIDIRATLLGADPKHRFDATRGMRADASAELRLDLRSRAGMARIFLRYESLHDSFIPPLPRAADLILIGLRIF